MFDCWYDLHFWVPLFLLPKQEPCGGDAHADTKGVPPKVGAGGLADTGNIPTPPVT